jgi:hypothetical protein
MPGRCSNNLENNKRVNNHMRSDSKEVLSCLPVVTRCGYLSFLVFLTVLIVPSIAISGDIRRIRAPNHDPLYVDQATIKRSGKSVHFFYVLDVPVAFAEPEEKRRWRSNEMEAVIECAARTYSILSVVAYAGPAATGTEVGSYTSTEQELKPAAIVPNSTFAHLADYVCKQR